MIERIKDLSEVIAGQGSYPHKPFLSCKNIKYNELVAILHDAPESHSTDFIFQPKKLTFAFPYNRGKQWLREIKDILLLNSAEVGQNLFPELYRFIKSSEVKFRGKIFIKTKCANLFSHEDLDEISRKILSNYIVLPQKFCSLDISCKRNEETSVEIGKIQIPNYSGNGFYIHFNLLCKLSRARSPKPLEYFSEMRELQIKGYGHNTCGRNGIFFILVQLFEYGNKLTEISPYIEEQLYGSEISSDSNYSVFYKKTHKNYIATDVLPSYLKQQLKNISTRPSNDINSSRVFVHHDKFGYGQIVKKYKEKEEERIDVLFSDSVTRTLVLKYAKDYLKFMSKKYTDQEFDDEVRITSENPIYENCIFNEGVFIEGNVYPIFISCSFYGYDSASVQLLNGSQGFFYNCRFNRMFPYILPNMKNCSFEPNATKDEFRIGGCNIDTNK